jgi:hypothetical protein
LAVSGSVALTNWPLTINVSSSAGISLLPISNANAATLTGSMGQLPGTSVAGVIKGSAGTLYKVWVTNRSTGSLYVQLFNRTSAIPNGTIPIAAFPVPVLSGTNINTQSGPVIDFTPFGVAFGTGIAIGLSSANATYVPAGDVGAEANFDTTVMYL